MIVHENYCYRSGDQARRDPKHRPILNYVIDGDANQQQTAEDVDYSRVTGEQDGQLALERPG